MIRHNRFRNNLFRDDRFPAAVLLLACLLGFAGCGSAPEDLTLDDLTAEEAEYLTRFVVLERARAVSFENRERGEALLDSLAVAWGDSAVDEALALLPGDPDRLAAFHGLLERVLAAEADSLLASPFAVPLDAAPTPPRPEPADDAPAGENG